MSLTPREYMHPQDLLVETLSRIYRYRMTTTSGGNLSILDPNGDMWITPSRVDKGTLKRDDIVCVHADGKIVGEHKPSSEYPFHRAIYNARPDIKSIIHAHSVALVAHSMAAQTPEPMIFPQASHVCGKVLFAPYELPGSEKLGERIAEAFAMGADCVILENHGVVVGGSDIQNAFERFETLEFTAKTIIKSRRIGEIKTLTSEQLLLAERSRKKSLPEIDVVEPTSAEKAIRKDIVDFVQRGYRQRLMTATEGTLSARLDDNSFVITNYGVDRGRLGLDEMTLIRNGRRPRGSTPSRAVNMHKAIYDKYPEVHAIVNAIPVNATAFSVTHTPLDSRTIPESYIFLREVQMIPYGLQFEKPKALADMMSLEKPVALLENDGVLVLGVSVLNAFDVLEVLESTAEALINAKAIGQLHPIGDDEIRELEKAFFGK